MYSAFILVGGFFFCKHKEIKKLFCRLVNFLAKLTLITMSHMVKKKDYLNSVKFTLKINLKNKIKIKG